MRRLSSLLILIVPAVLAVPPARAQSTVSIEADGWSVRADPAQSVLTIEHEKLGTVLKDVRLQLASGDRLHPLKGWSVKQHDIRELTVTTAHPPAAWSFEINRDTLKISSTSAEAVLTARAPAPKDRIVARLLDRDGVQVDWVGTSEVAESYGGTETHNRSFLPRKNPECMYLSLGQVAGSNLHSLFDRKSDIAVDFPAEGTVMRRNADDRDLLDLRMPVPGNALIRVYPDYYTRTLGVPFYVPFDDSYFEKAPMVWSSWTSYYAEVKEEDIVRNADWIAANLKPYGFEYVQLDDGYDRDKKGEHLWIENWDQAKFPHGPQWLTNYIKSKGLRAGLWIVPNAYAGAVEQHPDWYVHDKQGKIILDYQTPALDSSNPEVLAFVMKMFTTLDDWGFDYYKFDGEHALPKYVPNLDRSKLFDKSIDPVIAYRNRLKLIRETLGPHRFIEGCPAGTPLNGIGYFNSYFNGHDLYNSWQGMYALFSSINGNAFFNHLLIYVMPGEGLELGPPMTVAEAMKKRPPSVVETARTRENPLVGFGTTAAEARTLVTYVALTGVAYPLASILPELPEDRVKLLKATLPTMPILPVDLFSRGTDAQWDKFKHVRADDYIHNYPEILDLKVNAKAGVYDVVALTNWRSEKTTRSISFADKLGLVAGTSYVAFDNWARKPLGVFEDRMEVEIEPHDTRVILLRPVMNRPQLIGISRHITGAFSIEDLAWDAARSTLRGASATVAGDPYQLWIHVPAGMTVSRVKALSGGREVPAEQALADGSLTISFPGQAQPVNWEAEFAAGK